MKESATTSLKRPARKRAQLLLLLWALAAGAVWLFALWRGWTAEQLGMAIVGTLGDSLWGPVVYVTLYSLRLALLFSATVLTLAGGFLFGPVRGTLLTVFAANLSSVVAFLIGRYFGGALLGRSADLDESGRLGRWRARMLRAPFETVLIMRLIYLPYDGVSILAGFLGLPLPAFIFATILGTLPGTVQFVLLGASLEEFRLTQPEIQWTYVAGALLLGFMGLIVSRWISAREGVSR